MLLKIHTHDFSLTGALKSHVDSKIRLALGRYTERIQRVDITLTDINGPRGGEDMRCQLVIKPEGMASFVVQETAEDLYSAISIAAHRAKRSMERQMCRLKNQRRVSIRRRKQQSDTDIDPSGYIYNEN